MCFIISGAQRPSRFLLSCCLWSGQRTSKGSSVMLSLYRKQIIIFLLILRPYCLNKAPALKHIWAIKWKRVVKCSRCPLWTRHSSQTDFLTELAVTLLREHLMLLCFVLCPLPLFKYLPSLASLPTFFLSSVSPDTLPLSALVGQLTVIMRFLVN